MTFRSGLRRDYDRVGAERSERESKTACKTDEKQTILPQTLDRAVESGFLYATNQLSSFYNLNDRTLRAV